MLYLTISIIIVYLVYVYFRYGMLDSISESYRYTGMLFQGWCIAVGVLLFISIYKESPMVLFPSFGFVVVGLAPKYYMEWQKVIHYYGALFIIVRGCTLVIFNYDVFLGILITGVITAVFFITSRYRMNRRILWVELISIVLIISAILWN